MISFVSLQHCSSLTSTVNTPSSAPSQLAGLLRIKPCGNNPNNTLSGNNIKVSLSTGNTRPRRSRFSRLRSWGLLEYMGA